MKKIFCIVVLLSSFFILSFAQSITKKPTKGEQNINIEIRLNTQIDILKDRIDSLNTVHQKEMCALRQASKENCTIYYDRLDAEFDRTLIRISLVWGLFGVLIGLVIPIVVNKNFERHLTKQIAQVQEDTTRNLQDTLETINRNNKHLERLTIGRMRDRYKDIDKQLEVLTRETNSLKQLKEQLDEVKNKIETSERNAKKSQAVAMISRLYAEASKEYKDNPQRAIELYTRIISLNEKEIEAYNNRAVLFLRQNNYQQALDDTTRIISLDKTFANAYTVRGLVKSRLGLFDDALNEFSIALQYCEDPKQRSRIYIARAVAHDGLEQHDKVIEDYDSANKLSALSASSLNNRANAYLKLGQLDIAMLDAKESLKLCDKDDKEQRSCIYDTLGCVYFAKEMYKEALNNFNNAIHLNPQLWESYENRANLYKKIISKAQNDEEKIKFQSLYQADIQIFRNKQLAEKNVQPK